MNKLSIFEWYGIDVPSLENYKLIKKAGFNAVMLWWGTEDSNLNPDLARKQDLFVENIHTPFDDVNDMWVESLAGEAYIEKISNCIDDCYDREIKTMVVHLSSGEDSPEPNNIGLKRLYRLVKKAEKKDVIIALENLRKIKYLTYAFENIESNNLKFCYDIGHEHCRTPNEDALSMFGSKLIALHLHDNDGTEDQHKLPFSGSIDWSKKINQIKSTGYKGYLSFEITNYGNEEIKDPFELLTKAYDRAKRLQSLII